MLATEICFYLCVLPFSQGEVGGFDRSGELFFSVCFLAVDSKRFRAAFSSRRRNIQVRIYVSKQHHIFLYNPLAQWMSQQKPSLGLLNVDTMVLFSQCSRWKTTLHMHREIRMADSILERRCGDQSRAPREALFQKPTRNMVTVTTGTTSIGASVRHPRGRNGRSWVRFITVYGGTSLPLGDVAIKMLRANAIKTRRGQGGVYV